MMTLEEVKEELKHYKLNRVAKEIDVDKSVLYRMMGEHRTPSYETIKRLSDFLGGSELEVKDEEE